MKIIRLGKSSVTILVDLDGVLADFERGFLLNWRERYPEEFHVPLEERKTFYVREDYPDELKPRVEEIYHAPGFYRNLPVVAGAVEAMKEMVDLGFDVKICTAPLTVYEHCVLEKYQWVESNLGGEFIKRIMVAPDKGYIRGTYLIDDRPEIQTELSGVWTHILYDQPYNRGIEKPRLNWENWKEQFKKIGIKP